MKAPCRAGVSEDFQKSSENPPQGRPSSGERVVLVAIKMHRGEPSLTHSLSLMNMIRDTFMIACMIRFAPKGSRLSGASRAFLVWVHYKSMSSASSNSRVGNLCDPFRAWRTLISVRRRVWIRRAA